MIEALLAIFTGGLGPILAGGAGAFMRLIPEFMKIWTAKKDHDHEYRMTELQYKIDELRSKLAIDKLHAESAETRQTIDSQVDADERRLEMQAYLEAIKPPAVIGLPWADALSATIRPIITYWWMVLFTIYKLCVIVSAAITAQTFEAFLVVLWTREDSSILFMILGFWFVDRSLRKRLGY